MAEILRAREENIIGDLERLIDSPLEMLGKDLPEVLRIKGEALEKWKDIRERLAKAKVDVEGMKKAFGYSSPVEVSDIVVDDLLDMDDDEDDEDEEKDIELSNVNVKKSEMEELKRLVKEEVGCVIKGIVAGYEKDLADFYKDLEKSIKNSNADEAVQKIDVHEKGNIEKFVNAVTFGLYGKYIKSAGKKLLEVLRGALDKIRGGVASKKENDRSGLELK